jgi:methionyl-tRNA synthetase
MKYLGIDYGTKRVGLAISDEEAKVAFPKEVLKNEAKLIEKIRAFANSEKIDSVVIGESKDFDGNENPIMPAVKTLVKELESSGLKVYLEPEFLTSAQAAKIQGDVPNLDASAAAIILQSFLDKQKSAAVKKVEAASTPKEKIPYDDFSAVEMTLGKILSAEKIPDTDKLLKLSVDFGEKEPRQIVSGIALYFPDTTLLVGKHCVFVTNLEPRMIRGHESNGMIMALSTKEGAFSLLEAPNIPIGTKVK